MEYEKLISIIIPIYNVELYLEDCLDSILIQDFDDYEIICVDDASTDNSYRIAQEYAANNSQIRLLKNCENRGQSYTRNRAIKEAVGKYIMFVDSDDMIKENALRRISNLLKQNSDVDILYYDMEVRNEGVWAKEQPIKKTEFLSNDEFHISTGQELFVQLQKGDLLIVEVWRQLIKADFIKKRGILFYEGIYHEDDLFSFYCALNANKVAYMQEEYYIYRRRDSSTMSTMNLRRVQSQFMVIVELWNYWKNGLWSEDINWLFEDYLSKKYKQFINRINYYPNEDLQYFGNSADRFLYKIMSSTQNVNYEYVEPGKLDLNEIEKAKNVIIYGAGGVGVEVVRLLRSKNILIDKIVVSDKKSNSEEVLGIPISQFDECTIEEDCLIIIAILKSNEKAIENVVNNLKTQTKARIMLYDGTRIR